MDEVINMTRKNNGEGSIYPRSDGRWVAALQVGVKSNGTAEIRRKYAKTEAEAKRNLKELKKTAHEATPEQRKKHTVEKYILEWFPRYKKGLKPASYDRQENSITHQILPFLGQHQIHAVVPSDVKDLMNRLQYEEGYAYSTVKKAYDTLNECLRQAVEDGVLGKNPCKKGNKPKESDFINLEDEDDVRVLSDAEMERFCREAPRTYSNGQPTYRLGYAFILILNTGIRVGEALALRTQGDIDLKKRLMKIDSNMSYVKQREAGGNGKKYGFVEVSPKTRSGKRTLPLNDDALLAAQELLRLNSNREFLLANSKGNLTPHHNLDRSFKRILRSAGIDEYGIHALRHTYATALFKQKVDIKVISSLLGHADVRITYDTYVHLLEEQISDAATNVKLSAGTSTTDFGALFYDPEQDRMDIRFDDQRFYGGLHCGTPLEVQLNDCWVPTRIEKANDWFLVGLSGLRLPGLKTRLIT
jgi:integrase